MIAIMIAAPFDRLPASAIRGFDLAPGACLFRQDTPVHGLPLVSSGRLILQRVTEQGQSITICRAGPGETLAEACAFAERYHCDCRAEGAATGHMIEIAALRRHLAEDPGFALALMERLAAQVRQERLRAEVMSIRLARDRVLAALVGFGQDGSLSGFAASIGVSQEACSRALAGLVAEGRVRRVARGRYAPV